MVLPIVVLGAAALYFMTPAERLRLRRALRDRGGRLIEAVIARHDAPDAFHIALRERARQPIVTLLLVAVNMAVFAGMLLNGATVSDPDSLVAWGASVGPRTTNGEWWRLATATFVHTGVLSLAIDSICLMQLGAILERLVGRFAFAGVYVATGVLASAVTVAVAPLAVSAGASGAVLGLYGLLIACIVWTRFRPATVTIPMSALRSIAFMAAIFLVYNAVTAEVRDAAVLAGCAGLAGGAILARRVSVSRPRAIAIGRVVGVTMVFAIAAVLPLRGMTNARPEIERVLALPSQIAKEYEPVVDRFKAGRTSTKALADVINRSILPTLEAARRRVDALQKVPESQQALIADARVYLQLAERSWRLRAEALRKSNMAMLRQAETAEEASLAALRRIGVEAGGTP
jgi:membrane associated rhomboid family serine protease